MVKRKDINRSGWDEKKCQGYSKSTQRQCNSYPVHGLTVCRVHGGSSKRAKAAATRNLETEKLTRVARRLGTPHTDLDPAQALLDRVASKAGEVEWLRHQVELLESDGELWWGRTKESEEDNPHGREVRDRPGSPLTHRLHASPQSAGPARPVRHRNTQGWRRREISAHRGNRRAPSSKPSSPRCSPLSARHPSKCRPRQPKSRASYEASQEAPGDHPAGSTSDGMTIKSHAASIYDDGNSQAE